MRACGKLSFNLIDVVSLLRVANQIRAMALSDIRYILYRI